MYSIESHYESIHIHNLEKSPKKQYADITGGQSLFALSQAASLAPLALPLAGGMPGMPGVLMPIICWSLENLRFSNGPFGDGG